MDNKHFEITVVIEHIPFKWECTTMAEAYQAVSEIIGAFPSDSPEGGMDAVMESLVNMKNGLSDAHFGRMYRVRICDGEV